MTNCQPTSPIIPDSANKFSIILKIYYPINTFTENCLSASSNVSDLCSHLQHAILRLDLSKISIANPQTESFFSLVDLIGKHSNLSQSSGISLLVKKHLQSKSSESLSLRKKLKQTSYIMDLLFFNYKNLGSNFIISNSNYFINKYKKDNANKPNDNDINVFTYLQHKNLIKQFI